MTNDELKSARKSLGLSQADMGARLGLTQPQYSTLETGKRSIDEGLGDRIKAIVGGDKSAHIETIRTKPAIEALTPAQKDIGALLRSKLVGVKEVQTPSNTTSSSPTTTNEPARYTNRIGQPTSDKWYAQFKGVVCDKDMARYQGMEGVIKDFEHSGAPRFVVQVGNIRYAFPVNECEIVRV